MTWDIYSNPEQVEFILIPTGDMPPIGWTYEAVTANPEYLTLENVLR